MSKLVSFIFLGFCVLAVQMAPADSDTDQEEQVKKAQELVNSYGPQVEAKVRENDSTFSWESWWGYSKFVFRVINKIVPPNPQNRIELCKEDSEKEGNEFINRFGPTIEEEVRRNDTYADFHWDSWWSHAIPILKVIGEVVTPVSDLAKSYCEKDEELEQTQALVNSYGPQIELEVQKSDPTFKWDSWWRISQPILTVVNKVFKSDPEDKENLCKEDNKEHEKYMKTLGAEVEKRIKEFDPSFTYESWINQNKPILVVIAQVVKPLAEEANEICKEVEVKA